MSGQNYVKNDKYLMTEKVLVSNIFAAWTPCQFVLLFRSCCHGGILAFLTRGRFFVVEVYRGMLTTLGCFR
jgi:hypothetical protein